MLDFQLKWDNILFWANTGFETLLTTSNGDINMETSFNLSGLNKNNLTTARILSACSTYHPAETSQGFGSQEKSETTNLGKNKIGPEQQMLVDRIVEVLDKALVLLIDKVVTKLEEGLNKITGTEVSLQGDKASEKEVSQANSQEPPIVCNCNVQNLGNLLSGGNKEAQGSSSIGSFIKDNLLGLSFAGGAKSSFDGLKDLFGGLFESVKSFFSKPGGMLKSLFKGGILSGASKLLGGLL